MDIFKNNFMKYLSKNEVNKEELFNYGINIILNQKFEDQVYILNRLIYLYPENYKLYYYLGVVYKNVDYQVALMWFKLCYEKNPEFIDNIIELTKILIELDYDNECFKYFSDEIAEKYKDTRYILTYACILLKMNNYNKSKKYFEYLKDLDIENPNLFEPNYKIKLYNNLGHLYSNLYNISESTKYFKNAFDLILKNDFDRKVSSEILGNFLTNQDYQYYDLGNINNKELFNNYLLINQLYKEQNIYNFNSRKELINYSKEINQTNKKIKIGYVSSDFFYHAVSNFIFPIIFYHNKSLFDIYLFCNKKVPFIETFNEIIKDVKLIYIDEMKDSKEVSDLIYNLNIDILFDLNGHTSLNRLDIFALKPSPIQISYLGFPNTTGLKTIDYRLTDKIVDSEESTQIYSEKLIYLPKSFLTFSSILQKEPLKPKDNYEYIILGSLNKNFKISLNVLESWKIILKNTKNTKILMKLDLSENNNYLKEKMDYYINLLDLNNQKDRIIFIPNTTNSGYVQLFSQIDILLDTYPYSGTTTTCNALYNSIPVMTLYNKDRHVQSVSSSLLINSELPELVTYSEEEYVNKIINLSQNTDKIKEYKKNIHQKFYKNIMNNAEFVKDYEDTLINLYNNHFNKNVV